MDNNDNGYTIYCTRCGEKMNSNSRYCMKCGNLNYDHEANASMRQFIRSNNEQKYEVGSGNFINTNNNDSSVKTSIATNTGSVFLCFILTYIVYLLGIFGIGYLFYQEYEGNLALLANSEFPIIGIIISVIILFYYSLEQIYIKCNKRWWSALIPLYDYMVLSDIAFNNMILGLVTLIPVIGPIYLLYLYYRLGEDFSYNGILVLLFPFIYLPLMGMGTHTYKGYVFLSDEGSISVEKSYTYKKIFLFTFAFIMIFCIGLIIYTYKDRFSEVKADNYYYVLAADKIVEKTKEVLEKGGGYSCSDMNSGVYYFVYNDFGENVHLPLYNTREPIYGYVKVDTTNGVNYYVTLTDGKKGIYEVLESEIDKNSVTEYKYVDTSMLSNVCRLS